MPDQAGDVALAGGGEKSGRTGLYVALAIGLIMGLANVFTALGVDDGTFLEMGINAARAPLDPLGQMVTAEIWQESALRLSNPPVMQYWLALGYRIFGDDLVMFKLWMVPWSVLFSFCVYGLARRWAGAWAVPAVMAACLTPVVFTGLHIMLDIPAISLMLAGIWLFAHALDSQRATLWAVCSGVVLGLAVLTKYSTIFGPVVVLALAVSQRRGWIGVIPGLAALVVIVCWEMLVFNKYGQSQFLYRFGSEYNQASKLYAAKGLMGILGTGAATLGLFACFASGFGMRAIVGVYGLIVAGLVGTYFYVGAEFWMAYVLGPVVVGLCVCCIYKGVKQARSDAGEARVTWFLLGWLAIETAQAIWICPFPAGRRVFGLIVVMVLLMARSGKLAGIVPSVKQVWLVGATTASVTCAFWYADMCTFQVMRDSLVNSVKAVREIDPSARIYTQGLWSWQYYGSQMGVLRCHVDTTVLEPGDWLIIPQVGVHNPPIALVGENYGTKGHVVEPASFQINTLRNYWYWHSFEHAASPAVVAFIGKAQVRHCPATGITAQELQEWLKNRKMAFPVASTRTFLQRARECPDPLHNAMSDALIKWGEPWLKAGLGSYEPELVEFTRELIKARGSELGPGVAERLLKAPE